MTSLTCSSRHARTQRLHWMQASRFTAIAGCDRSAAGCGRSPKRGLPIYIFFAQISSSEFSVYSASGTSDRSSSSDIFWLVTARSLLVVTSIPSFG